MKHLILTAMMAVIASASAELYYATVNTAAYWNDKTHDQASNYSGYLCTVESAEALLGGKTTVADQTGYFTRNYYSLVDQLAALATKTDSGISSLPSDPVGYMQGQYSLSEFYGSQLAGEYLAVILYSDNAAYHAVRIFGAESAEQIGGGLIFDDIGAPAGSVGGWSTAPIPEPTGEFLLLLGLAGLALRRKA